MHHVRQLTRPFLDVVIIVGSFAQGILPHVWRFFPNAIKVLVFDAYQELGHIDVRHLTADVVMFPLGLGKTAITLCMGKGPELEAFSRGVGGMNARDGAGAAPALGDAAAIDLLNESDLLSYVRVTLANDLLVAANGPLMGVNLHFIGTINGATFAGATPQIDAELSLVIREATGAITTSRFYVAGPNVHRGLNERIPLNAASTLVRFTDYVTDSTADPNAIRCLTEFELPSCGRDEEHRQQLVNVVLQALTNPVLGAELTRVRPNNSINGPLGNFENCEFGVGRTLDAETEVTPPIAEQYATELDAVKNGEVDQHAIKQLELSHHEVPQQRPSIDDLMVDSANLTADQLVDELCQPAVRRTVTVKATIDAQQKYDVAQLPIRWHQPVCSLHEFSNWRQEQRRLDQMLAELIAASESELLDWTPQKEQLINRVKAAFGLLYPHGWDYVRAAWTPKRKTRTKLTRLAHQLRYVADEEGRTQSELLAVQDTHETVTRVLAVSERKLATLIDDLKEMASKGNAASPLIVPRELNERFPALWDVAPNRAALDEALAASADHITLDGLAVITGSSTCDLNEIARQVVHGGYCVMAPIPWGNLPRNDAGWTTHVLPPLEPLLANTLHEVCRTLDANTNLVFGETCTAGVVAVAVIMRPAAKLAHLFPPTTRSALATALTADYPVQFFPKGTEVVDKIGLTFDGKSVSFKK